MLGCWTRLSKIPVLLILDMGVKEKCLEEPAMTTDLVGYLTRYPVAITFGEEAPATVFDRYHTDDFVLYNDGVRLDRARILDHVRPARKRATGVHVDVHQALASDDRVAAHYTLTATMRNGNVIATEICMIGQLATDGRLRRVDQLTRILPASEDRR